VPAYFDWTRAEAPARPAEARVLAPLVGFKVQLPSMVYALMYFPTTWSQEYVNLMRVWTPGSAESVEVPLAQQLRFAMPHGMVYAAIRHGTEVIDGREVERGIGARMIAWATTLAEAAYEHEVDAQGRPLLSSEGTLKYLYARTTRATRS